jgi:Fe-S-cluster containining protein
VSKIFDCDKCGRCCQIVGQSDSYKDLDRGDGICKYYDDDSRLCTIYKNRPLRCNIDAYYNKYLKDVFPIEVYYQLNYDICKKLKRKTDK